MFRFANPHAFYLLLVIIPLLIKYITMERGVKESFLFSDTSFSQKIKQPWTVHLRHLVIVLQIAGVALLIVALARPQSGSASYEVSTEGRDIMMVFDISGSMRALDFKPDNRLEVAKRELSSFIEGRRNDRLGLVLFARRAVTRIPLTHDHRIIKEFIEGVDFGQVDWENGTAIGTSIATAVARLKDSDAESRIIVLWTDGANNSGTITPDAAARAAAKMGIKIYTVGIGRRGMVPFPVQERDPFTGQVRTRLHQIESDVDDEALTRIARVTGGEYFRAESTEELRAIHEIINRLETSEVSSQRFVIWQEEFYIWLLWGVFMIFISFILGNTRFRRIP